MMRLKFQSLFSIKDFFIEPRLLPRRPWSAQTERSIKTAKSVNFMRAQAMTRNDNHHEISTHEQNLRMTSDGMSDAAINVLQATAHCWGVDMQSIGASTCTHQDAQID